MRRRRKLWIILLAVPLLLVAADTLYWQIAVRNLEDGFAAWVAEQRAAGWTEANQAPVRGGWPLAATLTVPAVSLAGGSPDIPGGLAWSADRLVLRVALPRPGQLQIAAEGTQRLRFAGNPEVPYTADQLRCRAAAAGCAVAAIPGCHRGPSACQAAGRRRCGHAASTSGLPPGGAIRRARPGVRAQGRGDQPAARALPARLVRALRAWRRMAR